MSIFREQNAGQCHRKGTRPEFFVNIINFKIYGHDNNQSKLHEIKTKSGIGYGNVCCHSVQKPTPHHFLSKYTKMQLCTTIILPVVLYKY